MFQVILDQCNKRNSAVSYVLYKNYQDGAPEYLAKVLFLKLFIIFKNWRFLSSMIVHMFIYYSHKYIILEQIIMLMKRKQFIFIFIDSKFTCYRIFLDLINYWYICWFLFINDL